MAKTYYTYTPSTVGALLLAGDGRALSRLAFAGGRGPGKPDEGWERAEAPFAEAIRQLAAYFAGTLREFRLALAPDGTPFQLSVWRALLEIPYGETVSYGDVARRIGKPDAVRAVGAANGQNPIAIVIPCHRVIGRDGKLTGYGGGIAVKDTLLALERRVRAIQPTLF